MKLQDIVKIILTEYPQTRQNDKRLIWFVWNFKQGTKLNYERPQLSKILFMDYMQMPSSESITRAKRKVQEAYPELKKRTYSQKSGVTENNASRCIPRIVEKNSNYKI